MITLKCSIVKIMKLQNIEMKNDISIIKRFIVEIVLGTSGLNKCLQTNYWLRLFVIKGLELTVKMYSFSSYCRDYTEQLDDGKNMYAIMDQ